MNSASTTFETTIAPAQPVAAMRDYIALLKPRVMVLVVFSGIAGMVAALRMPGAHLHPLVALVAIAALAIGAGAAGAVNMWFDRDIDAVMTRTRTRPIPAGRVAPQNALDFAIVAMFLSAFVMALVTNWLAAALLVFAQWFYAHFYTMVLKRKTAQNIVIGGLAGAFPPLIGWAAVTGHIAVEPILYVLITFLWTPPHFWALALYSRDDYARAKIPMLPVTHGETYTRWSMLIYTLVLWPVSVLPAVIGGAGALYFWTALLAGALFTLSAIQVIRLKTIRASQMMFAYSILYLFVIYGGVIVDRIVS